MVFWCIFFCREKAMRSQWRARIEQERRNQLLLCRWKLSTVSVRIYLYQHIRSTYNLFSSFLIVFKQKIIDSSRVICISAFNVLYGCYSYYLPVSVSLFSIRNKSVMHWWISFSIARDWLPPLLKCLAIWLRFDPIFPYSLTSFLRSFMSATTSIWWLICFECLKITWKYLDLIKKNLNLMI